MRLCATGSDPRRRLIERAWSSHDPNELNRANAVQAGYENVINTCVRIAQELCTLEAWTTPNLEPSSTEALKQLR
jgi:hypothetical protein